MMVCHDQAWRRYESKAPVHNVLQLPTSGFKHLNDSIIYWFTLISPPFDMTKNELPYRISRKSNSCVWFLNHSDVILKIPFFLG